MARSPPLTATYISVLHSSASGQAANAPALRQEEIHAQREALMVQAPFTPKSFLQSVDMQGGAVLMPGPDSVSARPRSRSVASISSVAD